MLRIDDRDLIFITGEYRSYSYHIWSYKEMDCWLKLLPQKKVRRFIPRLANSKPLTKEGRSQLPDRPGCYAIFDGDDRCLYVGMSVNSIKTRLSGHKQTADGERIYYWLESRYTHGLERMLIRFLKPLRNTHFKYEKMPDICGWNGKFR